MVNISIIKENIKLLFNYPAIVKINHLVPTMEVKQYICWLWNQMRDVRNRIAMSGIVGIIEVGTGLSFVWISKQLIDIATRTTEGNMQFHIALLIGTMCLQIILSSWKNRLESLTEIRLKNKLRYNLFSQLMYSSWNGKERFHSGDVVNRLEEDVRIVSDGLSKSLPMVIVTLFQFLAAFLFLSRLNSQLAWIIVFIMPVFLLLSKVYVKRMRNLTKNVRNTDSRVQSHIQEKLQHKVLIQILEQNKPVSDKLDILQAGLYGQVMSRANFTVFSRALVMTGFAIGYLLAFLWGVKGIYENTVTFGMMTAFLQLVGQIQRPMVELSRHIPSLVHTITSAERLKELDELPVEEQGTQLIMDGNVGIRMENISFSYPDGDKKIIDNFSFDFTPGSRTAIIGETGVGKSTLIRLMLALLKPQQGKIFLYNYDRKVEAGAQTRSNLAYVPQGNTLLSGTIRENLLFGDPNASEEQLKEVLHTVAADFVYDLPNGLETMCGERGTGLSEGQVQRICIARGLLRPGSVLLLDEFSSSLDKDTERLLMERLVSQANEKTLIFITHREVVATYCHHIIKLERS